MQVKDLTWLSADGQEMGGDHWGDERTLCFGMLLDGRAQRSGIVRASHDASVVVIFNAWHDAVEFALPPVSYDGKWSRVIDTAAPEGGEPPAFDGGATYLVTGRSMLGVLQRAGLTTAVRAE